MPTMEQLNDAVQKARREVARFETREAKLVCEGKILQRKVVVNHKQLLEAHSDKMEALQKADAAEKAYYFASMLAAGVEDIEDEGPVPLALRKGDIVEWKAGGTLRSGFYLESTPEDARFVRVEIEDADGDIVIKNLRACRITNVISAE